MLPLDRFRPWLYAAAAYNAAWGAWVVLAPRHYFALIDMPAPEPIAIWQVVGMCVAAYAPGYWWAARDPLRFRHYVVIGLLGKTLGPLGFAIAVANGGLPARFGWTLLANDVVWWIPFALFLREAARASGGWAPLLRGD
jgi:small multidrug resistance pump